MNNSIDSLFITQYDRVDVLENIAKSYLVELTNALDQAKIAIITGTLQPNETPTMLEVRKRDLQVRVDSLIYKLEGVGAL
jgi:hypothetical protein